MRRPAFEKTAVDSIFRRSTNCCALKDGKKSNAADYKAPQHSLAHHQRCPLLRIPGTISTFPSPIRLEILLQLQYVQNSVRAPSYYQLPVRRFLLLIGQRVHPIRKLQFRVGRFVSAWLDSPALRKSGAYARVPRWWGSNLSITRTEGAGSIKCAL